MANKYLIINSTVNNENTRFSLVENKPYKDTWKDGVEYWEEVNSLAEWTKKTQYYTIHESNYLEQLPVKPMMFDDEVRSIVTVEDETHIEKGITDEFHFYADSVEGAIEVFKLVIPYIVKVNK